MEIVGSLKLGKVRFATLFGMAFWVLLFAARTSAQSTYSYSSISYDSTSNTITAYAQTQPDYTTEVYYSQAFVQSKILDANNTQLASQSNQSSGVASVSYQAAGDGSAYYTVLSGHALFIAYYVNNCYCGGTYSSGWDDYYNYQYFAGLPPPYPDPYAYYTDFAQGPEVTNSVNDIVLQETFATTAPPCPVPINFRLDQSYPNVVNGDLFIKYLWDSSTGNQADLSNVDIGELVNYPGPADPYTWPSPPWAPHSSQNPHPEIYTGAG